MQQTCFVCGLPHKLFVSSIVRSVMTAFESVERESFGPSSLTGQTVLDNTDREKTTEFET